MPIGRMLLFDQQKCVRSHASPPELYGDSVRVDGYQHILADGGVALRADDHLFEDEIIPKATHLNLLACGSPFNLTNIRTSCS
jgi:hypothetical protein